MNRLILDLSIAALPLLFAFVFAEVTRGYVANYLGDKTGKLIGRLSFDPSKHIDPINTLLLPLAVYLLSGGLAFVGGAKPIPVDIRNFAYPKKALILLSCARAVSHFLQAVIWTALFLLLRSNTYLANEFFLSMAQAGISINIMLFTFVLLPLPPYDGGTIVSCLLPDNLAAKYQSLAQYSLFIIIALIVTGILFYYWMFPLASLVYSLIKLLFSPFVLI